MEHTQYEIEVLNYGGIVTEGFRIFLYDDSRSAEELMAIREGGVEKKIAEFIISSDPFCLEMRPSNPNYCGLAITHTGGLRKMLFQDLDLAKLFLDEIKSLVFTRQTYKRNDHEACDSKKLIAYLGIQFQNRGLIELTPIEISRFLQEQEISAIHVYSTQKPADFLLDKSANIAEKGQKPLSELIKRFDELSNGNFSTL